MKKNIRIFLLLVVMLSVGFGDPNSGGKTGNHGSGPGTWYRTDAGIKFNLIDQNGKCKAGIILITSTAYKQDLDYYNDIGVRLYHKNDTSWVSANDISNSFSGCKNLGVKIYDFGKNANGDLLGQNLADYFQENQWYRLKEIVNENICNKENIECNSTDFVVVEPMARANGLLATACEFALAYSDGNNYNNCGSNFWCNYGHVLTNIGEGRFSRTIYVNPTDLSQEMLNSLNEFMKKYKILQTPLPSPSKSESYSAGYWIPHCNGTEYYTNFGMGIFPYNVVQDGGTLRIIKKVKISNDDSIFLANTAGLEFTLYKGNDCITGIRNYAIPNGSLDISLEPGTYSIKESNAPSTMIKNDTCINNIVVSKGNTKEVIVENDLKPATVKVRKIDSKTGKLIGTDPGTSVKGFKYNIYEGKGCTGNPIEKITARSAEDSFSTDRMSYNKDYSLKEQEAPNGYEINKTCFDFKLEVGVEKSIEIKDEPKSCVKDVNELIKNGQIKNLAERAKIFKKYKKQIPSEEYRNLLNINIVDAAEACGNPTKAKKKIEVGCMSATTNTDEIFYESNLSNYEFTFDTAYGTAYCVYDYIAKNNYYSNTSVAYSGRLLFPKKYDESSFDASLYVKCYIPKTTDSSTIGDTSTWPLGFTKSSDFVGKSILGAGFTNVLINDDLSTGLELNQKVTKESGFQVRSVVNDPYQEYSAVKELKISYYMPAVYVKNGSGKKVDFDLMDAAKSPCDKEKNCTLIGYGIPTPLNFAGNGLHKTGNLGFTLGIAKELNFFDDDTILISSDCKYTINPGVIQKDNYDFEFRVISTDNTFPGKDGTGRKPGKNWDTAADYFFMMYLHKIVMGENTELETIGDIKEAIENNCNGLGNTCDFYTETLLYGDEDASMPLIDDGVIDELDIEFLDYIIKRVGNEELSSFSSDLKQHHYLADYIMEKTNNSYDKNGTGPIYTIYLGKNTINNIRDYNKTHEYDDYTLECDADGKNCKSTFLRNSIMSSVVEIK